MIGAIGPYQNYVQPTQEYSEVFDPLMAWYMQKMEQKKQQEAQKSKGLFGPFTAGGAGLGAAVGLGSLFLGPAAYPLSAYALSAGVGAGVGAGAGMATDYFTGQ